MNGAVGCASILIGEITNAGIMVWLSKKGMIVKDALMMLVDIWKKVDNL